MDGWVYLALDKAGFCLTLHNDVQTFIDDLPFSQQYVFEKEVVEKEAAQYRLKALAGRPVVNAFIVQGN